MALACIFCGNTNTKTALPLKKEDGFWVVKPVCDQCRRALKRQAREAGKTIEFFGLEGSLRNAGKRNAERKKFSSVLEAFAKVGKTVGTNGSKPKLARV